MSAHTRFARQIDTYENGCLVNVVHPQNNGKLQFVVGTHAFARVIGKDI